MFLHKMHRKTKTGSRWRHGAESVHGGLAPASFNIFRLLTWKKDHFTSVWSYISEQQHSKDGDTLPIEKGPKSQRNLRSRPADADSQDGGTCECATHFSLHGKSQSASAKFWMRNCLCSRMFWMLFRSGLKTTLNVLPMQSTESLTLKTPQPRRKSSWAKQKS